MMLARLILAYRKQNKISVRQLAKSIGMDYSALSRFERGREVTSKQWMLIAKWLMKAPDKGQ